MPKGRTENVVTDDGKIQHVKIELKQRGETKTAEYDRPTRQYFGDYIAGLGKEPVTVEVEDGPNKGESWYDWAHRMFTSALDKAARAGVYESLAQESTFITLPGGVRKDVMEFPLAKLVTAINGMRGTREVRLLAAGIEDDEAPESVAEVKKIEAGMGYGPWRTAGSKLVKEGKAKENDATGLLELTAA